MSTLIAKDLMDRSDGINAEAPAFAEFFASGYPRLVRLLISSTENLGAAEELAQEAMARVFERWNRVGGMDSPLGYAYATAVNANRRRFRRPLAPLGAEVADPAPDPAADVIRRDALLRKLAALSQSERDVVLLVSVLGLTAEEAGRLLKVKAGSVRSRLHRARASLREMEENDHG